MFLKNTSCPWRTSFCFATLTVKISVLASSWDSQIRTTNKTRLFTAYFLFDYFSRASCFSFCFASIFSSFLQCRCFCPVLILPLISGFFTRARFKISFFSSEFLLLIHTNVWSRAHIVKEKRVSILAFESRSKVAKAASDALVEGTFLDKSLIKSDSNQYLPPGNWSIHGLSKIIRKAWNVISSCVKFSLTSANNITKTRSSQNCTFNCNFDLRSTAFKSKIANFYSMILQSGAAKYLSSNPWARGWQANNFLNSFNKIIWVWKLPDETFNTISMVIQNYCVIEDNVKSIAIEWSEMTLF